MKQFFGYLWDFNQVPHVFEIRKSDLIRKFKELAFYFALSTYWYEFDFEMEEIGNNQMQILL